MNAHKPRKRQPTLKGVPPVNPAEKLELQALQRAADLEFALRETQAALRKVIHHVTTDAPSDAFRLGMCHAAAEEGLLRADSALGTQPARRRATDRPKAAGGECVLSFNIGSASLRGLDGKGSRDA